MRFSRNKGIKIVLYPYEDKNNPFVRLLRSALEMQGVSIVQTDQCNPWWLLQNIREVHALHFHWIQSLYSHETFLGSILGLLRFSFNLFSARLMGYQIIWTAHNLFPHESKYPMLDRLARKIMVFFSNTMVVHCNYARDLVKRTFHVEKNIAVIPHGHYADYYATAVDKRRARSLLNLSQSSFIFLMFGRLESYKGVSGLIRAFKAVNHDCMLVIAGRPSNWKMEDRIQKQAGDDARIKTILRYLDDEELANLIIASDLVVAPFRNVLTSGTVIAALSLGRPVLAPSMGCLPETIEEGMGFVYEGNDNGLITAMQSALKMDFLEAKQIKDLIKTRLDWNRISRDYKKLYWNKGARGR